MSSLESGLGIGGLSISKDEVGSSAFDLFKAVEIDTSIVSSTLLEVRPITSASSAGPFHFVIPADPHSWTSCDSVRLSGRVRLRKLEDDVISNLTGTEDVSVVNNFFHSLFKSINVSLNQVELSDPSQKWYPYKSYIETLLSYSQSTKCGRLSANSFFKDTAGEFDDIPVIDNAGAVTTDTNNIGYKERRGLFKASRWAFFCINLHTDLTTLRRFIPPDIKIEIDMQRTEDKFSIMSARSDDSIRIEIEDLVLGVRRFKPSNSITSYHKSGMNKFKKCFLPIDRSLIKTYAVMRGALDLSHYNFISGNVLPDQIVVGMIAERSYNGTHSKNPFNFQHFDISEASLVVNGIHEPENKYRLNITNNDYISVYNDLMENTGVATDDRDFWLTPADFIGGNFLLVWDRSKEKCNRFHRHASDSGTIDINIRLRTAIQETTIVLVYATYSSDIVIDSDNKVMLERL